MRKRTIKGSLFAWQRSFMAVITLIAIILVAIFKAS